MPISHENARLRGRIGGNMRAAMALDRNALTQPARDALWQRFLDKVPAEITDPEERQRRAEMIRKAHMARLTLKASVARSRAAAARRAAEAAEAEAAVRLAAPGGPQPA